MKNINRSK